MKWTNIFLFSIPALIWGSTWFAIKFQIGETDPLLSVGYRFLLASIILFIYSYFSGLKLRFSFRGHLSLILLGTCLFGLNYWLVYLAEERLTSGLVAVIFSGLIFMNIFLNSIILRAPLRLKVVIGALVGMTGMVLIFHHELLSFDLSNNSFIGFLLAVGSVVLASSGNIISAFNQKRKMPVVQTNAFGMLYGSMLVMAVAILSGKELIFDQRAAYVISLLYLALFGSVFAFGAYLKLLGNIGPDKAGYVSLVMPLIALVISTFFEGYQWTLTAFLGILLILTGNFLALKKPKKQKQLVPVVDKIA